MTDLDIETLKHGLLDRRFIGKIYLPEFKKPGPRADMYVAALERGLLFDHLEKKRAIRDAQAQREKLAEAAQADAQLADDDNKKTLFADWDSLDFLAAAGMLLLLIGFVFALFSSSRPGGILFPVGAVLLAIVAYAARSKDQNAA